MKGPRPRPLMERFMGHVHPEPNSGCWLWSGAVSGGYGTYTWMDDGRKVTSLAHRFSYEKHGRAIPEDLQIDHLCRNKLCVNPDHMEPVTARENMLRSSSPAKARARQLSITHCKAGHLYSGENLIVLKNGYRACRACFAVYRRRHYAKKRIAA